MKETILKQLQQIEETEQIRILYAAESGSRAWGFASPDSDYDVRFIYVRPQREYLRLQKRRDVIELPIDSLLDINGWDLDKALQLLYRSNPTLFEWLSSPIVYRETDFAARFRALMAQYFSPKRELYHYLSSAEGNRRKYLMGETVRAKKYFYVLRPLLACRWILEKGTPPPMLFSELMQSELPAKLKPTVDELLALKMNSPEIALIPRIAALDRFFDAETEALGRIAAELPDEREKSLEALDAFFLAETAAQF